MFSKLVKSILKPKRPGIRSTVNGILSSTAFLSLSTKIICVSSAEINQLYQSHIVLIMAFRMERKAGQTWVDRLLHFGHTITSRIEGSHAKLKTYLATSTLDLKGVYDKVVLYWTAQHMDYDTKLALARFRTPHQCQIPIFFDSCWKSPSLCTQQNPRKVEKTVTSVFTMQRYFSLCTRITICPWFT